MHHKFGSIKNCSILTRRELLRVYISQFWEKMSELRNINCVL